MEKTDSRSFYKVWHDTVNKRKDQLLKIWHNYKEFTLNIKGEGDSVMEEVANRLNLLRYSYDYYSVDNVLYTKDDLVPELGEGQYWLRDMRVAFENENNFKNVYQEVSHLLITNCDLRVLVTYPQDDDFEKTQKEYLHKIIKGTRHSKVLSDEESFLMIFGYENNFQWVGFIYKEDDWVQIN